MKKKIVLIFRIVSVVYALYFASSLIDLLYMTWDGSRTVKHQTYYVDSLNLQTFCERYEKFCSNDSIATSYISLYGNEERKVRFIEHADSTRIASCEYYSKKSRILMLFNVLDSVPLIASFYGVELTEDADSPLDIWQNINSGRNWFQNKKYISAFEEEVLSKVCTYERDDVEGFLNWYYSFFERNFPIILLIGLVLIGIHKWGIKFGNTYQFYIWRSKK